MRIILKNFIVTLRRFKLASTLNILGLSIAFAAFMAIMMQVRFERSFDKDYNSDGRIYRVEYSFDSINYDIVFPRPLYEFIAESQPPQIKSMALMQFTMDVYINVDIPGGSQAGFMENIAPATYGITEVFGFEMIEGSADALKEPGKVIISQSTAEKLFKGESAIGRTFTEMADSVRYEIGGVYRDFLVSTSFPNSIYRKFSETGDSKGNWNHQGFIVYALLDRNTDPASIAAAIPIPDGDWNGLKGYRLNALDELYYITGIEFDHLPKGNREATDILLMIAIFIIGIAIVNFINFSTSLTPLRITNINTQKVLGCPERIIKLSILFEAAGFCIFAYGLALLWIYLFNLTGLSSLLVTTASLESNSDVVLGTLLLAFGVGTIAGLYPAFYMTSFPPALVLKGSFGLSASGRRLRNVLIGFQFIVSITLIIAAIFLQLQTNYIRNYDGGLYQDQIAILDITADLAGPQRNAFISELKSSPLIEDVAFTAVRVGITDNYGKWGGSTPSGDNTSFHVLHVSDNFPEITGMTIVDGNGFSNISTKSDEGFFILNETAARKHGFKVGDSFSGWKIIGIVKDFNYTTLRSEIQPMALLLPRASGPSYLRVAYVKTVGDPYAAVEHIKKSVAKFDPVFPVDISFFDLLFDNIYQKEQKTTKLVTLFSILAVVISLVGVFGLVVFEIQYRRKEIGVRKVYGATIGQILAMFNRSFILLVGICFVIAVPIAYIGVKGWLGNFAYRTPLHWWVFAAGLLIVAAITTLTVTVQSWRAASANPTDSLKSK